MTDILIRNVADSDLKLIEARAARLGLSRSEYLRRRLIQEAVVSNVGLTVSSLQRAAELSRDILDDGVMRSAWS